MLPIVDIILYQPWDPKALNDDDVRSNHFRGDSACSKKVIKLGNILGTEITMDLNALVYAVNTACQLETSFPTITDEELENLHPFLGWKPVEVIRETLENTTPG